MTKYRKRYRSKTLSSQHQPLVNSMKADTQFVLSEFSLSHSVSIFIQRAYLDCKMTILLVIKKKGGKRDHLFHVHHVSRSVPTVHFIIPHTITVLLLSCLQTLAKNRDFSIMACYALNGYAQSHSTTSLLL